eukprot:gene1798-2466_t
MVDVASPVQQFTHDIAITAEDKDEELVLGRLEDFFSSPAFTSALGDFMREHASGIQIRSISEEQPPEMMGIYQAYQEVVEEQLEHFLRFEAMSAEEVSRACLTAQQDPDKAWMSCIDYLVAAVDFEQFLHLLADFRRIEDCDSTGLESSLETLRVESVCNSILEIVEQAKALANEEDEEELQ